MTEQVEGMEYREYEVPALEGTRPLMSIDEEGRIVEMGKIGHTDYGEEGPRALFFEDGEGNVHKLGSATGMFQAIGFAQVLRPFLDLGFTPGLVSHRRGGAGIMAVLHHPEHSWPDPIYWDRDQHSDRQVGDVMNLATKVEGDLRVGKGFSFTMGFFRLVCINGLVSKHLMMGSFSLNHRTFSEEKVMAWGQEQLAATHQLPERTIDVKALDYPIQVIGEGMQHQEQGDEAAYGQWLASKPGFVQRPLSTYFRRVPKWAQGAMVEQMQGMQENLSSFSLLDLINAVTNLTYLSPQSEMAFRVYHKMEAFFGPIVRLTEVGAFRADVSFVKGVEL